MFGLLDYLKMAAGAVAGAALMYAALAVYAATVHDPSIRRAERATVEAEAAQKTLDALKEVGNAAEKDRAMLRYCRDDGRVYDFASHKCK